MATRRRSTVRRRNPAANTNQIFRTLETAKDAIAMAIYETDKIVTFKRDEIPKAQLNKLIKLNSAAQKAFTLLHRAQLTIA